MKIQEKRNDGAKCKYLKGSFHLCLVPSTLPGNLKGNISGLGEMGMPS